uniref:TSP1_CCN domain-containing protein n=1 Tax=Macrostomum lignano TaxID=282301 RepID=A0A1I8IK93_9PLAT
MEKERTAQVEASSGRKTDKAFPKTVLIQANTVSIGYLICSVSIPLTMLCIANINTACIALQRGLFCTASKSTGSFEWTQWTSCSLSCGSQQNRSRPAGSNRPAEVETRPCPTENSTLCKFASATWTHWSQWGLCKQIKSPLKFRFRECVSDNMNVADKYCAGLYFESDVCNF